MEGLMTSIHVASQNLKELYLDKRLNAYQIAKLYGCGHSTIYRRLKSYGIVCRGISESHIRYSKESFSGDNVEKAYLIGFRLGDLWVKKLTSGKSQTIRVDCHSTKNEQIEVFKKLFERYSKVIVTRHIAGTGAAGHNKNTWKARVYLDLSFNFLLPKKDAIESWMVFDNKYFWAFVAGYSDAEGCFSIKRSNNYPSFHLQSYDKNILSQIRDKLEQFNIVTPSLYESKSEKYTGSKNNCIWRLSISRKQALKLFIINLRRLIKHSKRRKDMERVWELIENE